MAVVFFQNSDGDTSGPTHFNGGPVIVSPNAAAVAAHLVRVIRACLMHPDKHRDIPSWLSAALTTRCVVEQAMYDGVPRGMFHVYLPKEAVSDDGVAAKCMGHLQRTILGDSLGTSWPGRYHCGFSAGHHRPLTDAEKAARGDKVQAVEDPRHFSVSLSPLGIRVL